MPQWNSFDKDIAEAPSLGCFKNRLQSFTCVRTMLAWYPIEGLCQLYSRTRKHFY